MSEETPDRSGRVRHRHGASMIPAQQVSKIRTSESPAQADPSIAKFVTGAPKKIVFVPGRLINVVI